MLQPLPIKLGANVTSTNISEISIEVKKKKFTYSEVMEITKNLARPLGEGGFGVVYHGDINGSQQVAVKLLSESSTQGYKEFKAEVRNCRNSIYVNQCVICIFFHCSIGRTFDEGSPRKLGKPCRILRRTRSFGSRI